jgi:hypothetical protein
MNPGWPPASTRPLSSWPACDASLGKRRREILRLRPPTLVAAGILTQTACRIQREQTGLRVEFGLSRSAPR